MEILYLREIRKAKVQDMRTKNKKSDVKITTNKRSRGRPSIYNPEFAKQAYKIVSETGCTNLQLANILEISLSALESYTRKEPDFKKAIKNGWYDHTTAHVEKALKDRALGYEYKEVHEEAIILVVDGIEKSFVENKEIVLQDGKDGKQNKQTKTTLVEGIKRRTTTKFIPPSELALFFWLQNRHPEEWKNVQRQIVETKNTSDIKHTYDFSKLRREELEQLSQYIEAVEVSAEIADEKSNQFRIGVSASEALHSTKLA